MKSTIAFFRNRPSFPTPGKTSATILSIAACLIASVGCDSTDTAATSDGGSANGVSSTATMSVDDGDAAATVGVEKVAGGPVLIDVRSTEEYDDDHLDDSVHIPHEEIADRIASVVDDKDREIIVFCAAGARAEKAKTALESLGYTNVRNAGGIDDVRGE